MIYKYDVQINYYIARTLLEWDIPLDSEFVPAVLVTSIEVPLLAEMIELGQVHISPRLSTSGCFICFICSIPSSESTKDIRIFNQPFTFIPPYGKPY